MKCANCKCVVPDSCDFCMYCGSPMPPSGSTRTIPVQEYRNNVTHYYNVSDFPPRYAATEHNYPQYNNYHQNRGYSGYQDGYWDTANTYDRYNGYMYANPTREHYTGYNVYEQRGNYDNRNVNAYYRSAMPVTENNNTSKLSKILLLMIAADVLSLILVLVALLLFVL